VVIPITSLGNPMHTTSNSALSRIRNFVIKILLFCALSIWVGNTFGQLPIATFENNIVTLPSLQFGNQNYKDIVLKNTSNLDFDVTAITDSEINYIEPASLFRSNQLIINALRLGDAIYSDLKFEFLGGNSLRLVDFRGPVRELSFTETDFYLREPIDWKTNERVYDGVNSKFLNTKAAMITNTFHLMDIDRDGKKDILVISSLFEDFWFADEKMPLRWLRNTGDGFELGDPEVFPDHVGTYVSFKSHVADINGDGFDDLFISDTGYDAFPFAGGSNYLLLSEDGGLIDAGLENPLFDYSGYTHGSAIGDINNDGHIDIATVDSCCGVDRKGMTRILINDGFGNFERADIKTLPEISPYYSSWENSGWVVSLTDLNNDGYDELIIGSARQEGADNEIPNTNPVVGDRVYWNDKSGVFDLSEFTELPPHIDQFGVVLNDTLEILASDVNFDGKIDLILSKSQNYRGAGVQFLINEGGQNFSDATEFYSPWAEEPPSSGDFATVLPFWLKEIDLNGDGLKDLKLQYDKEDLVNNKYPHFWLKQFDGTYKEAPSEMLPEKGWYWLIDYDNDGDPDLIRRSSGWTNRPAPDDKILQMHFEWSILENKSL
jgi:hypothetical protein